MRYSKLQDSQVWRWYWDVKFHVEPLEKKLRPLWNDYNDAFYNQQFYNNKSK